MRIISGNKPHTRFIIHSVMIVLSASHYLNIENFQHEYLDKNFREISGPSPVQKKLLAIFCTRFDLLVHNKKGPNFFNRVIIEVKL